MKTEEEEGQAAESYHGVGVCKWFNVRMGFGFLSMSTRDGVPLQTPVDVFVHQVCVVLRNMTIAENKLCDKQKILTQKTLCSLR